LDDEFERVEFTPSAEGRGEERLERSEAPSETRARPAGQAAASLARHAVVLQLKNGGGSPRPFLFRRSEIQTALSFLQ